MNKPVSDSTPLILYAKIGRLDLLKALFNHIYIPEAVYTEVVTQGKNLNLPDAYIIEKEAEKWIHVTRITSEINTEYSYLDTNTRLDLGEKQALKLCKQIDATVLLADDKEARRVARMLNIKPVGTLGLTIQAFRLGAITQREAETIVNALITSGLRIDTTLYKKILDILKSPS